MGGLHVAAAFISLVLGVTVLVRRKGGTTHVALGRLYVVAILAVNLPVLVRYEATGGPGPFHVLAVVSLVTTALGWLFMNRGRTERTVAGHASLMTWSWIGVATAGLAQAANQQWPAQSPWPVITVVAVATASGLAVVPRYVSRQLRRRKHSSAGPSGSSADGL